jgi:hypothetical protein
MEKEEQNTDARSTNIKQFSFTNNEICNLDNALLQRIVTILLDIE